MKTNKVARKYIASLQDNSAELMQALDIPPERYAMFAKLAVGIAKQESNFDEDTFTKYNVKENLPWIVSAYKWWNNDKSAHSSGLTQIKLGDWRDKKALEACKKFGINEDSIWEPDKSAIATVILLDSMYDNEVQGGLKSKIKKLGLTDEQALLYLWHRRKEITKETATPAKNKYIRNVEAYYNKFNFNIE